MSKETSTGYHRLLDSVAPDLKAVDKLLDSCLGEAGEPLIAELARHLIDAGGKRLRPLLTLAIARGCGYDGDGHIALAAAVELIHSATLLHDDVVDGSALRRGRAGANTLWGNKATVLVGDYLFSRSFDLMVRTRSLDVLRALACAASTIAEGEVMQLSTAGDLDTEVERYLAVVEAKTAALFQAAAESGAIIAEAQEAHAHAYAAYGRALGVAFQLADDALDYAGKSGDIGKDVGDDFNEGKATLPALIAYRNGNEDARAFWVRTIVFSDRNEADLDHALRLVEETDAVRKTLDLARRYASEARQAIEGLPQRELHHQLGDLAHFAAERRS